jgi:hypothetical protein
MSNTYALIKDGIVINTIMWDGPDSSPVDFPEDVTYEEIPDKAGNTPSLGWKFKKGTFSAPPLTSAELEVIEQQKIANNIATKESLLATATQQIVPLQTKLLLGRKLTASETETLNALLDYVDDLESINSNTTNVIAWPDYPS